MAGWRRGQLSYRAAPLAIVAGDLSRSLGVEVAVDPRARRPALHRLDPRRPRCRDDLTGLAATLGLQARRTGNGWLIEPHSRAPR